MRLVARDRRRYGGYIVHLAMVFVAVGAIGSTAFRQEDAATLRRGESLSVGRYTLTYLDLFERRQPGVQTVLARLDVRAGERPLGRVAPERRIHVGWEQQPITGVAIHTTWPWADDLYVLLTGWEADRSATIRVLVNPLVVWIWLGAPLFLLGTLVSAWPSARARAPARAAPVPAPVFPPREVAVGEA